MSQASGRALVVEDDQSWRQILTEILDDMGLAVDTAVDAAGALASLQTAGYRLAVVDLSLVGNDHQNQDGLQVLDVLHRDYPTCTAILLSGFATAELAAEVLEKQIAYACLHKEAFRRGEFRGLVEEALERTTKDDPYRVLRTRRRTKD